VFTGMDDDVISPGATSGTLYVADTDTNTVYAVHVSGLNPDVPVVSLGSFGQVDAVNPQSGDFLVPEPSSWAMLLLSLAALLARVARRLKRAA
jgi:DNA-binding beta-propeller fold protein YncE